MIDLRTINPFRPPQKRPQDLLEKLKGAFGRARDTGQDLAQKGLAQAKGSPMGEIIGKGLEQAKGIDSNAALGGFVKFNEDNPWFAYLFDPVGGPQVRNLISSTYHKKNPSGKVPNVLAEKAPAASSAPSVTPGTEPSSLAGQIAQTQATQPELGSLAGSTGTYAAPGAVGAPSVSELSNQQSILEPALAGQLGASAGTTAALGGLAAAPAVVDVAPAAGAAAGGVGGAAGAATAASPYLAALAVLSNLTFDALDVNRKKNSPERIPLGPPFRRSQVAEDERQRLLREALGGIR